MLRTIDVSITLKQLFSILLHSLLLYCQSNNQGYQIYFLPRGQI